MTEPEREACEAALKFAFMTEPEREAREAALKFALDYPSFGGRDETIFERAEKYRRFLMGEPVEPVRPLCETQWVVGPTMTSAVTIRN